MCGPELLFSFIAFSCVVSFSNLVSGPMSIMSDPSDLEEVGSESSISGAGSEFAEERLDFPPPNALPEFPNRVRSGPILRLPNRVWMAGERRMERLLVGHFLDRRHFHTRTMQLLVNELGILVNLSLWWHDVKILLFFAFSQNRTWNMLWLEVLVEPRRNVGLGLLAHV